MQTKSPLKPEILNQAIVVAMSSQSKKKVGSIILKKGKITASAVNLETKSHPIQASYGRRASYIHNNEGLKQKQFLHSEMNSLIRSKGKGDTIVVARVGGRGGKELRNSRPCVVCSIALKEYGIKHIHYSTDQGFLYEYWGDN
jgi:deoxycytidylate deaminase